MRPEARKYLFDIQSAVVLLGQFTDGKGFLEYTEDPMLRAAVEREFEIIGEALARLAKADPSTVERISNHRQIISFRNVLIHGYADVDHRLVWGVLESNLATLKSEVDQLLDEARAV